MRILLATLLPLCFLGLVGLGIAMGDEGDPNYADDKPTAEAIAALRAGDPVPEGEWKVQFPFIGKQSLMCIGDSFERQIAFVDFGVEEGPDMLGTGAISADGNGTAKFTLKAAHIRTGHKLRDEKLMDGAWLDAESHPELALEVTQMTRVDPTVYDVRAKWTMHGVTKDVRFLANIRYIPEMKYVGKHIVRVKAAFDIDLHDFEMRNPSIDTLACARVWTVDIVVLGLLIESDTD